MRLFTCDVAELRQRQTEAESLGLHCRFSMHRKRPIIEIDAGYHDQTYDDDLARDARMRQTDGTW
jgi:very-short-patch-repair endonuclease